MEITSRDYFITDQNEFWFCSWLMHYFCPLLPPPHLVLFMLVTELITEHMHDTDSILWCKTKARSLVYRSREGGSVISICKGKLKVDEGAYKNFHLSWRATHATLQEVTPLRAPQRKIFSVLRKVNSQSCFSSFSSSQINKPQGMHKTDCIWMKAFVSWPREWLKK